MCRASYIEKWLQDNKGVEYMYVLTNNNILYELENYWYFRLDVEEQIYSKLLRTIDSIKNQNLYICMKPTNTIDLCILGNIHTLRIYGCKNIKDVSTLGRVHNLNLINCKNIEDISVLGNVYKLSFGNCNKIKDVNMLGNVHTLEILYCVNVTDISGLTNVYNVSLIGLNVTNVKALHNARSVNIYSCEHIVNIGMLAHIFVNSKPVL